MDDVEKRVMAQIEDNFQEQVSFLQEIVRCPSVLFEETSVQQRMHEKFHELGLTTDVFDADVSLLSDLPGYSPVEWGYKGRPQVVGTLPSRTGGGRSLVLNGHVDVVPPGPIHQWHYDPWGAKIVGDKMYGRGALDMKSGVSSYVYAVQALQQAGVKLQGDLILQSVIEEECTGNGTLACLARGYVGDGAFIPENFGGPILAGEMGVLWLRTVITGGVEIGQTSFRYANAIEKCYDVIRSLRELEAKWNANPHPAFANVFQPVNFWPGTIRGGDWPSSIPTECEFVTRLSFYPGTTPEQAKQAVLAHLQEFVEQDEWLKDHPPAFSWYGHHDEGFVAPADDPLIALVGQAHEQVTGQEPQLLYSHAVTDARFWRLYYGKPATCYGPAGGNGHLPNEWVSLPSVLQTTKVAALTIMNWCGVAP